MNLSKSRDLFEEAQELFPGGVNSPVRAFKSVGAQPIFIEKASGAYLYDVDGREYIDYIGSWGPMINGHTHPEITRALRETSERGLSFGTCHELEIKLAKIVREFMPGIEMMRFVSSGTEACMSAVRLARAYTSRPRIIKFAGNYHGHFDSFLVEAGSGIASLSLPDSPGVLPELAAQTLIAPYNDLTAVKNLFVEYGEEIAVVIIEPVVGNSGCLLPREGFLEGLRQLCDEHEALLIFDEVMTGFRVARGGAGERFGVKADLVTLGKIIGGGLPVGAYGGRKDIMSRLAPEGIVYQAGTLSGNPLGMAAGIATLELLRSREVHQALEKTVQSLKQQTEKLAQQKNIPIVFNYCGGMFTIFFTEQERVENFEQAKRCELKRFGEFFRGMLERGIYFPPSQFEAAFISNTHTEVEIEKTIKAIADTFSNL